MPGPNIGYATLSIIPSLQGVRQKLSSGLNRPAQQAGEEAGDKASSGFGAKFAAGVAIVGAAAGAALFKGFSDALGAEDVEAKIGASLGISPERAAELGSVASGLYRDAWGDNLAQVGDAVASVERSLGQSLGLGGLEGATEKALAFAQVFDTDVGEAVANAGVLINQGLARASDHAFALLTSSFQRVAPELRSEVLAATNEYSKFFGQLGLSGEQAFGLLVSASQGGQFEIDKTGDALKELTIRSTDMSAASVAAFESAGLNAETMAAQFLAGGDTAAAALQATSQALLGIEDPTKRANAAIALFGTPLEDIGTEQIPEFLSGLANLGAGMGDVSGAADLMADRIGGTNSAKIEAFKRRVLGGLADFAANRLIPAFEGVGSVSSTVFGFLANNEPVLIGLATSVGILATAITAHFVPALFKWAAAQWTALAPTIAAALPVIALAAAVGALVAGVIYAWKNFETFRDITRGAWEVVKTIVGGAVESITGQIQGIIDIGQGVITFFKGVFTGDFSLAWDGIRQIAEGAVGFVTAPIRAIISTAREIWTFDWFRDAASGAVDAVVGFFTGLPGRLGDLVVDLFVAAQDLGSNLISGLLAGISKAGGFIADFASGLADAVVSAFKSAWNSFVAGPVNSAVRSAVDALDSALGPFVNFGDPPNVLPELRAAGGRVLAHRPYVVGELGAELFWPDTAGTIVPNAALPSWLLDSQHETQHLFGDRDAGRGGDVYAPVIHNYRSQAGPDEIARGIRLARTRS